ncbi:MAG: DegT/DnrJ/EryC1/StrS family aminotransferase [Candidatus Eisenbacteria bacterium]|nr:DegT/DnrJ/EryC1/StrS family aminotransferase [Candidatus Eisenbacteria bacterium]MCC7143063.1 DegT/DnrJ/EryC1/StrS family aminotransferase [Candidatus Eisenbacteria bacterium]
MQIPLVDLKAQYAKIGSEIDAAISEVIHATAFIGGPTVKRFEQNFARFCGAKHAVGCSSGTSALHLALLAAGVGPGDEVITVSHTFIATAEVVKPMGARVRFVDIDPETYTMDPAQLVAAITPKTKVILPVHIYGHPADMGPILEIARAHGITVVEDAAQAHGAKYHGRSCGALAPIATFSFYPGKNLGAYGDAGAVTCESAEQADRMNRLANHGRAEKYLHDEEGYNYRLDGLQAAILDVKLRHLESWNEERRRAARLYDERLRSVAGVSIQKPASWAEPVYHLYVIRVAERDRVLAGLREQGIDAGIHYPVPLHLQPAYRYLGIPEGSLPETERAGREVLSLPIYPEITEAQIDTVVAALKKAL